MLEGRRTFGNIMKYIKMAASGNFGNMISVVLASILLPFLPLKPVQILTQNLLCDFAQLGIPFDRVDESYLSQPRKWDTGSIQKFMFSMGPLSCIFDLCCYAILWWAMGANTMEHAALFQCGNFVYGTLSQILVVHMIRTEKIPFAQSRPAAFLMATTLLFSALTLGIGFSGFAAYLDMAALPLAFLPWLLPVSYTHLDVYKRQNPPCCAAPSCWKPSIPGASRSVKRRWPKVPLQNTRKRKLCGKFSGKLAWFSRVSTSSRTFRF